MSFKTLGIDAPILQALEACGYAEPTAIQEKAIPPGIAGRDILGSAQTGTGKTCAFGVPLLQRLAERQEKGRPIRALILTPTRELAIQIDESLRQYGENLSLRETVIFGGVGQNPQVEELKAGVDVLTATPGRLLDLQGQGLLDLSRVEIFVLDEADRMLDMGFIHDVRRVLKLLPEKKQTMFFSATLPPEIMDLVDSLLHNPVKVAAAPVSSPVEVIRQEVCLVDRNNKTRLLKLVLDQEKAKNALVFTRTKHGADKVVRELEKLSVTAAAIHGNKSQTARQESLRKFKAGEIQVLVATDIAARGLDIEELSHVFNYNLPEVAETYIHRIGRTGRAGHEGTAVSFCDYAEMPLLKDIEKLLKKPIPRREHPFPMEVFEIPLKDAKGRAVNAEDAEARQAAREKSAARKKLEAEKAAARKEVKAEPQVGQKKPKAARRPMPHGKQSRENLQTFLEAEAPSAEPVNLSHHDPLEGEVIMDATARLLAAKPIHHPVQPRQEGKKPQRREEKKAQPASPNRPVLEGERKPARKRRGERKGLPVPEKKAPSFLENRSKRSRGRNRTPPRVEGPKSHQKDSTEQQSLMKPFYIDHD